MVPYLGQLSPRMHSLNLKYIDDLSMLTAINLKYCLMEDPTDRPFNFNERTSQVLPGCHNMLQEDLNSL